MPNFMYKKKKSMEIIIYHYYCLLLPFYICVHVNFYFQVHQGRVRNDIGLVTFCFDHVIFCKLRVLSPKT
jgi:hypothetical protein